MNVLLFSCLVSTIIFLLWYVQRKRKRVINDKIYAIWFVNLAIFTYPISAYLLLKMIVNFLSGELLLA